MGTRTYSRRGANGIRVPTALGIRTGKATAPTIPVVNPLPQNLLKRTSYTPAGTNSDQVDAAVAFTVNVPVSQYTARNERYLQYGKDGTLHIDEGGGASSVMIRTSDLIANQSRAWLSSHNHPYSFTSFSPEDIETSFVAADGASVDHMHVRTRQRTPEERDGLTDYLQEFDVDEIIALLPQSDRNASWVINPEVFRRVFVEHVESIKNPNVLSVDYLASRQTVQQGLTDGRIWVDRLRREQGVPSQSMALVSKLSEFLQSMNRKRVQAGKPQYNDLGMIANAIISPVIVRSIIEANKLDFSLETLYNSGG